MDATSRLEKSYYLAEETNQSCCNLELVIKITLIVLPILTGMLTVLASLALGGVPFAVTFLASIGAQAAWEQGVVALVALTTSVVSLIFLKKSCSQKQEVNYSSL